MSIPPSDQPSVEAYVEPWLRGTHTDVPAVARAVLHALELALNDLKKWTEGLTDAEIHCHPFGLTPVASQLRHVAHSTDRLLTYAEGKQLSEEQLKALRTEERGDETLAQLLAEVETSLQNAAERVRALAGTDLEAPRSIGRNKLPASAGGTLIHVADHTQRHVGQVVTTVKVLRQLRGSA
jgi:uncharacterized damage-inducible protein DinB